MAGSPALVSPWLLVNGAEPQKRQRDGGRGAIGGGGAVVKADKAEGGTRGCGGRAERKPLVAKGEGDCSDEGSE